MEIQYTAPYTPQQNPTERANCTIKTMVAQYIQDKQKTWDELLPELNLAINSSVSDSTVFSPAFIIQGREPRLPGALYDEVTPGPSHVPRSPVAKAELLRDVYKVVQTNTQRASMEQRKHYDLRRRAWRPTLGSLVFAKQHHLSRAATLLQNMAAGDFPDWRHLVRCVEEAIGPCPGQYTEPSDPAATLEEAPQRGQDASSPDHVMESDEASVMDDFAGHVWRIQDNGPSAVLESPNEVILRYADGKGSVSATTSPTPPLETIEPTNEEDLRATLDLPPDGEMPALVPIDTPGEDSVMELVRHTSAHCPSRGRPPAHVRELGRGNGKGRTIFESGKW
ncbi:uncharacterized protein [Drosophila takahashii]|uniref:uncharacterized protein n=1 Tax=Drosophila takahashii TaxID=29030 RepID=UPI003898F2E4